MKKLMFVVVCLSTIPIANASVVFSEVAADANGSDDGREWVEFYVVEETNLLEAILPNTSNLTNSKTSGWRLLEGGVEHRLSLVGGNETVQPGSYFIVADDAAAFANETGYNGTLFDSSFSLSNAGETLVLKNSTYNVTLTYNATPEGKTFCVVDAAWGACEPTPGYTNKFLFNNSSHANPSQNMTNTTVPRNISEPLTVISYPSKLKFGASGFITASLGVERARVYAYGYPKKVLVDDDGIIAEHSGTILVPLQTKDNCNGLYDDGMYRVRVRAVVGDDIIETKDINLHLHGRGECAITKKEEAENEQSEWAARVYLVESPDNVTLGDVLTVRAVIVGKGVFDVYSYLQDDALASAGGWAGNKRTLNVTDVGYAELQNNATRAGNLTLVVKARDSGKTYEAAANVVVLERVQKTFNTTSKNMTTLLADPKPSYRPPVQKPKGAWDSFIDMLRKWIR
ncbi:MAG: lamin tail domain-containing protein [Candidatus Aenigmarchaeota archaeon]|nr:lamin tail domain-containing protein [Candidatus Aenigmarchaeota archaeon]